MTHHPFFHGVNWFKLLSEPLPLHDEEYSGEWKEDYHDRNRPVPDVKIDDNHFRKWHYNRDEDANQKRIRGFDYKWLNAVQRLLWIAILKEDANNDTDPCYLARLPKDILKVIFFMVQQDAQNDFIAQYGL